MTGILLYLPDPAKHMRREYRMDAQPDLFGQWCLMREWGRLGSTGPTRFTPFPTRQEVEEALNYYWAAKERRGYHLAPERSSLVKMG